MEMTKLAVRDDLDNLHAQLTESFDPDKNRIFVCMGTGCKACGGDEILSGLEEALEQERFGDRVEVVMTGCRGFCENGALVSVRPLGTLYCRVGPDDIPDIVGKTVENGEVIDRLLYEMPGGAADTAGRRISAEREIPFYLHQESVVLGMNSRINPAKIEDYIREGGYAGLARALFDMSPDQIIDEVLRSGLRGRGGGGFPTGQKWKFCRAEDSDVKYIICNADEGDPGAFMDRSLLEGNPNAVLEGMAIAARAIGSSQGYIYIRAEYPLAIERLRIAIDQMRRSGLLGEIFLGRISPSISSSRKAPAPSSAAKRLPSSPASKAAAACPPPARRFPPSRDCSANRPISTTSKPWAMFRTSSQAARKLTRAGEQSRARERRFSPSSAK